MGLSIKNEEVEERIRRLTELTGEGVTEAVDAAVKARLAQLERSKEERAAARLASLDALLKKYGPFPPLDQKAIDDEIYDENGIER
jgi:antitoxin VapB